MKAIGKEDDYPMHMDIKETKLPAIKKWDVGKKYKMVVEAEMTGISKGYDGKGLARGEFIVQKIESAGEVKGSKESKKESKMPGRKQRVESVANRADY